MTLSEVVSLWPQPYVCDKQEVFNATRRKTLRVAGNWALGAL